MVVRLGFEKPGYATLNVGHAAVVEMPSEVGNGAGNAMVVIGFGLVIFTTTPPVAFAFVLVEYVFATT